MHRIHCIRACVVIPLLVMLWPACGRNRPESGSTPRSPATGGLASSFKGSGSCSAVACHGSTDPVAGSDIRRNEHTTWITEDPHSLAYQTLLGDRSQQIVRNLSGWAGPVLPANRDERCLACHSTPRSRSELMAMAWMDRDGVGCESCHGAAEKWVGPHRTGWWKRLEPGTKERDYGLLATKNLTRRIEVCTGCHVGRHSPAGLPIRDVNHDLIAAGHPRLNFEFAAYQDNLPVHWTEKGRNAAADFPALAWAVGQTATAKAALELLRDRAASGRSPWPEFSEYNCFSCHHNLADEKWRRNRPAEAPEIRSGSPRWGSWYFPMTRALTLADKPAGLDPQGDRKQFMAALEGLVIAMSTPIPDREKVQSRVNTALKLIGPRIEDVSSRAFVTADVERFISAFHDPKAWGSVESWDHATQRYLALEQFYQAWCRLSDDRVADRRKLRQELDELLRRLKFDEGYDSPRGFDPTSVLKGR